MNNIVNKFNITNRNKAAIASVSRVLDGKKMPVSSTGAGYYLSFYVLKT